jgi:hypothetical protein
MTAFRNSNKVWIFFLSIALVFLAFLFFTYCVYRRRGIHNANFFHRLGLSGLFSLVIGITKEILDAVGNDWFWCDAREENCNNPFSIWDVAIYVDGIVLAVLLIVSTKMCTESRAHPVRREAPCERTVASSIDCEDDDDDNENANCNSNSNHAASSKHGRSDDEIPAEISITDENSNTDASASTKESTSTEETTITNTSTSDSTTGLESDSDALDDDEEQQIPPV